MLSSLIYDNIDNLQHLVKAEISNVQQRRKFLTQMEEIWEYYKFSCASHISKDDEIHHNPTNHSFCTVSRPVVPFKEVAVILTWSRSRCCIMSRLLSNRSRRSCKRLTSRHSGLNFTLVSCIAQSCRSGVSVRTSTCSGNALPGQQK